MAEKLTRTLTVTNPEGIHLRAAVAICTLLKRFDAVVTFHKQGERVKGTDTLQILSLGTTPGMQLLVEAGGKQAREALDALERLFAAHFEEAEQGIRD